MTNTESLRHLHFVGTMPQFEDAQAAIHYEATELAGALRRWYAGETGARLEWFVPVVKALKLSPKIRVIRHGDWSNYDDTDRLSVRRGAQLTAEDIPLELVEHFDQEWPVVPASEKQPMQVGVPGYLDMALFIFGPAGALRYGKVFREALALQIASIQARAGKRVVFQLEIPAALIAVASMPRPLRGLMARLMGRLVTAQVRTAPDGTRFGVHLCLGDLGHQALRQLRDAGPLVALTNAIVRQWPSGRSLDFVHLPMSGGDQPPSTNPRFYQPLRMLKPRRGMVLAAGIAHEQQNLDIQLLVRGIVETAVGGHVDIATSCGLGRRTPEQASHAVARMRDLTIDD